MGPNHLARLVVLHREEEIDTDVWNVNGEGPIRFTYFTGWDTLSGALALGGVVRARVSQ